MDIFVERANFLKEKERILSSIAQKNTMIRIVLAEIEVLTKQKCNHIDAVDKLRVEIRKHNIEKESYFYRAGIIFSFFCCIWPKKRIEIETLVGSEKSF